MGSKLFFFGVALCLKEKLNFFLLQVIFFVFLDRLNVSISNINFKKYFLNNSIKKNILENNVTVIILIIQSMWEGWA